MPKRAYRVTLSITVLVEANNQEQADQAAQQQFQQLCQQLSRMPEPPKAPRTVPKKANKIAGVPADNHPRPFVKFGRN